MPEEREALGEFFAAGLVDAFRHRHPETVKYSWWDMVTRATSSQITTSNIPSRSSSDMKYT